MRVSVSDPDGLAPALLGNLLHRGYAVVDPKDDATYRIQIEPTMQPHITLDVPDGMFGRLATHAIGELSPSGGVLVMFRGGNQNDRLVVARVPRGHEYAGAVERGMVRALDRLLEYKAPKTAVQESPQSPKGLEDALTAYITMLMAKESKPWWRRLCGC